MNTTSPSLFGVGLVTIDRRSVLMFGSALNILAVVIATESRDAREV